ncbi:hypothetical protein V6N13_135100 [Hibiscus sabdariffa]
MISSKFVGQSSGKIVNLFNVDVKRIGNFCCYIHGVCLLPIQVFPAMFATILAMASYTSSKIMEAKDSRTEATSDTLKSLRILKLHSWD